MLKVLWTVACVSRLTLRIFRAEAVNQRRVAVAVA